MTRTWRGHLARTHWYFLEGNSALVPAKAVLYVLAALKILGLAIWQLVGLAPVIYALHVVAGWVWVQHGWYKELTEVPTVDSTNPVQQWQLYMLVRVCRKLKIPVNGVDLSRMPPELTELLRSCRPVNG